MTSAGIRTYRITLAIRTHRLVAAVLVWVDDGDCLELNEEELVMVMMVRWIHVLAAVAKVVVVLTDVKRDGLMDTVVGNDLKEKELL
jgi:hypothetical protein